MYIVIHRFEKEFKPVRYPGIVPDRYLVSNYGDIFDIKKNEFKRLTKEKDSEYVRLSFDVIEGGKKKISVHRIVAWEFVHGYDEDTGKINVNHLDSIRYHNYFENLEWVTLPENSIHGYDHGSIHSIPPHFKGITHPKCKTSEDTVEYICQLLNQGLTNIKILNEFGFTKRKENKYLYKLIQKIKAGDTWTHISSKYEFTKNKQKKVQRLSLGGEIPQQE